MVPEMVDSNIHIPDSHNVVVDSFNLAAKMEKAI